MLQCLSNDSTVSLNAKKKKKNHDDSPKPTSTI